MTPVYDFIVVGSGAGGATVAKELSSAGKRVMLLEKGRAMPPGTESKAYSVIRSGVEIWLAECLGGTTTVSMGNAVRSRIGRRLDPYFEEAERELGVVQMPFDKMGPVSRKILELSNEWIQMPKCIDFSKCRSCGSCAYGCPHGAKWSSRNYVKEAESRGCRVETGSPAKRLMFESGRVCGVELMDGRSFRSRGVVLAAGAIETPRILIRSGIAAGKGLFVDTFITVGGIMQNSSFNREVGMPFYLQREGFLISPHYSSLLQAPLHKKGVSCKPGDIVGLMAKIGDEPSGAVTLEGVEKESTQKDLESLEKGRSLAKELLLEFGVEEETIVESHPRGVHPGGTCRELIRSLDDPVTEFEGLFISDASIIPGAFGLPPILTIIALAKRVSSVALGTA